MEVERERTFNTQLNELRNRNPSKSKWYAQHDRWGRVRGPNQPYFDRYNEATTSFTTDRSSTFIGDSSDDVVIDLGEDFSSETTRLLPTPTPGSGPTITPSGAPTTAVDIALKAAFAAYLLGGGTLTFLAFKAIYNASKGQGGEDKKGGFNFPLHQYVGPGNQLDRGTPIDEDDVIAKEHDEAYDKAKTVEDVQLADEDAFQQFITDWLENGNYHSLLSAIGIKGKAYVEKLIGHRYPNLTGTSTSYTSMGKA